MPLRRSEPGHTAGDVTMLNGAASGIWGPQQHQLRGIYAAMQPTFGTMAKQAGHTGEPGPAAKCREQPL